jgi:coatomer subunit delta
LQNKEAEAKEELKRRAKQLEMQRREQQRRAASGGGGGPGSGSYLGGGVSGYAPVPQRFDAPTPARTASPAPSSLRTPSFKGSGMKLGSKKTKQAELLDALGGSALLSEEISVPNTPEPSTPEPSIVKSTKNPLPEVTPER